MKKKVSGFFVSIAEISKIISQSYSYLLQSTGVLGSEVLSCLSCSIGEDYSYEKIKRVRVSWKSKQNLKLIIYFYGNNYP